MRDCALGKVLGYVPMNVLLAEDDRTLRETLIRTLARRGVHVRAAADGPSALAAWRDLSQPTDVVVLDLSLPGLDGLEVLAQARAAGLQTPVIITTARTTVGDRIVGLNTGADDYLAKPFDLDELEARMKALARRSGVNTLTPSSSTAGVQNPKKPRITAVCPVPAVFLRYDNDSGAFYHLDAVLDVTPRESALLRALLHRPGQAVSKEQLFLAIFPGEQEVAFEAVEVIAYRLRKKIKACGLEIVTLRGLGYLLRPETPAEP